MKVLESRYNSSKVFKFSKEDLWTLFLISAFPVHFWTILLVLRAFAWVTERTNAWDAIGVGAYGLLIAFTESLFVFGVIVILGALVQEPWKENKRITLLCILIPIVSGWAMLNQLYFLTGNPIPQVAFRFLTVHNHPLQILFIAVLIAIISSVVLPVYFILKSERVVQVARDAIERISVLSIFYLMLDVGALIIVVLRNF